MYSKLFKKKFLEAQTSELMFSEFIIIYSKSSIVTTIFCIPVSGSHSLEWKPFLSTCFRGKVKHKLRVQIYELRVQITWVFSSDASSKEIKCKLNHAA